MSKILSSENTAYTLNLSSDVLVFFFLTPCIPWVFFISSSAVAYYFCFLHFQNPQLFWSVLCFITTLLHTVLQLFLMTVFYWFYRWWLCLTLSVCLPGFFVNSSAIILGNSVSILDTFLSTLDFYFTLALHPHDCTLEFVIINYILSRTWYRAQHFLTPLFLDYSLSLISSSKQLMWCISLCSDSPLSFSVSLSVSGWETFWEPIPYFTIQETWSFFILLHLSDA